MRRTARLSTWPPTVKPIWASSPVAFTAVVTSSAPRGGDGGRGGGSRRASVVRFKDGEPDRTARGPGAGLGFAAAFLGAAFLGFAAAFTAGSFVAVPAALSRRRPSRAGRVLGRL